MKMKLNILAVILLFIFCCLDDFTGNSSIRNYILINNSLIKAIQYFDRLFVINFVVNFFNLRACHY